MKTMAIRWTQKIMLSLVLVLMAALCLAPASAGAKDSKATTVKMKVISSGPPATKLPVGDDPGHTIGITQVTGTATLSDGQKAKYQAVMASDIYIGWFAKSWGYSKLTFKDGSTVITKWKSAFTGTNKAGNYIFKGGGAIEKGTGAYFGIKGKLTFAGLIFPPDKGHPTGYLDSDAVWTYTLPSK